MNLILTEKPSVAADFAKAIGCGRRDGYFIGKNYMVTFCVGHLLELCEPEDYDKNLSTWSTGTLPIIPPKFKYKPSASTKDQLSIIDTLLNESGIDNVILATDAGREGELIGRLVLDHCKWNDFSRVKRFWSSEALTPDVINQALSSLKDIHDFDRLFQSGQARQHSDWLVGMNFSRFFSVSLKSTFSVGRVQTSVLNLIVKRQREIEAFVPEDYFRLIGIFSKLGRQFKGVYKVEKKDKFKTREELDIVLDSIKNVEFGSVVSVEKKIKKEAPPPLFNLTALQKEANKRFGFSADKTLSICQSLYETHKCLSYPRTPSRVLGSNNVDLVLDKITTLSSNYPDYFPELKQSLISKENKRVFDDSKLEDHHALIPLAPIPHTCTDDEKYIYYLVLSSFSAVFHPDYEYESVKAIINVNGVDFHSTGMSVIKKGWTSVLKPAKDSSNKDSEEDSSELPRLEQNETVKVDSTDIESKKTTPPPFYTEALLLEAMENPNKYKSDESTHFGKNVGLGTQATRAAIIEILLKREYILRDKKKLIPTTKGIYLIDSVSSNETIRHFIDVDETARWEQSLEENPAKFLSEITSFITAAIAALKNQAFTGYVKELPNLGKCPSCGAPVVENNKSYHCSAWKAGCTFTIWKEIAGASITKSCVAKLLSGKTTKIMKFKKKDSTEFESKLALNSEKKIVFVK